MYIKTYSNKLWTSLERFLVPKHGPKVIYSLIYSQQDAFSAVLGVYMLYMYTLGHCHKLRTSLKRFLVPKMSYNDFQPYLWPTGPVFSCFKGIYAIYVYITLV